MDLDWALPLLDAFFAFGVFLASGLSDINNDDNLQLCCVLFEKFDVNADWSV